MSKFQRRSFFLLLLTSPLAQAEETTDCLLLGDSWAFMLKPRLERELRARHLRFASDPRGGQSAQNFLKHGWWKAAVEKHRPKQVVACLGINCIKAERPQLGRTIAALCGQAPCPVLWVVPSQEGFRFDLQYLREAVAEAEVPVFSCPPLPLESDRVHLTAQSNERLAALLSEQMWPKGT